MKNGKKMFKFKSWTLQNKEQINKIIKWPKMEYLLWIIEAFPQQTTTEWCHNSDYTLQVCAGCASSGAWAVFRGRSWMKQRRTFNTQHNQIRITSLIHACSFHQFVCLFHDQSDLNDLDHLDNLDEKIDQNDKKHQNAKWPIWTIWPRRPRRPKWPT